jgi:hypothetical protein
VRMSYDEAKKTIAPCIEALGPVEALAAVAFWLEDRDDPDARRRHRQNPAIDEIINVVHRIEKRDAEAAEMRRLGWRPGMRFEEDRDELRERTD